MIIRAKSWIYRKFGIYLAHKEELEYVTSKEFWKDIVKLYKHKDNDMSFMDLQGLLIGMWQVKHKFYRKFRR